MIAMENAGFIVGSYVLTFGVLGLYAWSVLWRGRKLANQVDDADKYWT